MARMFSFRGGLTFTVEIDGNVPYARFEDALHSHGFLTDYLIDRQIVAGRTRAQISLHVPMTAITAAGVPAFPAVQVLRAAAEALAEIESGIGEG